MTVEAIHLPPSTRWGAAGRVDRRLGAGRLVPYLPGLAVVLAAALLAWQLARQDREQVAAEIAVATAGVEADFTSEVQAHVRAFQRMAERWSVLGSPRGAVWQADVDLYFSHYRALTGLAWLAADDSVRWQTAREPVLRGGVAALATAMMPRSLAEVRRRNVPRFGAPVGPPDRQRLLPLYLPFAAGGDARGRGGMLVALLDSQELLDSILADQLLLGYGVDVSLYGVPIYRDGVPSEPAAVSKGKLQSHRVELFGAPWVVRVWPGAALLAAKRSWLPAGVLLAGVLLGAAFAVSAAFARRAGRHSRELEWAKLELERSNSELEQFAYVASHDLQEPLRQVASFLGLLERRYGDRLDAEAHEFIGFAVDGAHRMQQLISDLLTYSRVGTRGGTPEPTDPASALGRAVADLRQAIEESRALITNDGAMPPVMVDPQQLALVFRNLVSNAIKYAGDTRPQVHVSARRRDGEVEITVADHGIGIEPRFFDRIFVIFQRLHTREQYPGTGIGLAIVRRAVEQNAGRVWVESAPGEGAAFHLTLPAAPER